MPEKSPILYLIRHGEKPKLPDGEDGIGLNDQGLARAQALVGIFGRDSPYDIGYIIAQEPKKHGKETRPKLTVEPLAKSLGVPFNTTIGRDDTDKVADAVSDFRNDRGDYTGDGNVLICWEHETLEKIASALGVEDVPDYPGKRFDLIWTIKAPYTAIEKPITSEHVQGLDDAFKDEP